MKHLKQIKIKNKNHMFKSKLFLLILAIGIPIFCISYFFLQNASFANAESYNRIENKPAIIKLDEVKEYISKEIKAAKEEFYSAIKTNKIDKKIVNSKSQQILYIPLVYNVPDNINLEGVFYTYFFKKHVMVPLNLETETVDLEFPWILGDYNIEFKTWADYCKKNYVGDQVCLWNKDHNCFQIRNWANCHYDLDGYGDYTETFWPKIMIKGKQVVPAK